MFPDRTAEQLAQLSDGRHDAEARRAALLRQSSGPATLPAEWLPILAGVPVFQALSKRHLRRVAHLAELRRFRLDAQVVQIGGKGDAFYVVLEGEAHVTTPDGHMKVLRAGDYFGELALFDGAPRAARVTAGPGLAAARIPRTAFLDLLKKEPDIAFGITKGLVAIVRESLPAPRRNT